MLKILLLVTLTGAVDVQLSQHDGTQIKGSLVGLGEDQLTLGRDGQTTTIATDEVHLIRFDNDVEHDGIAQAIRVSLRNGSRLLATRYRVKGEMATIELISGFGVKLPTNLIDHVVLMPSNPALDRKRGAILAAERPGDIVTVRRRNENLEFYDGVLSDISDETIRFKFGADWNEIRRSKIDAIRYHAPADSVPQRSRCKLVTDDTSSWHGRQLVVIEDRCELVLANNVKVSLPIGSMRTMEFASGATVFLSDLQPEKVSLTPSVEISALSQDLKELGADEPFLPRDDHSFSGREDPLRLAQSDGRIRKYAKGLAVHSRTQLTYRLAGEFREFRAIAGLDPSVRKAGAIVLAIRADEKELLRSEIHGGMSPIDIAVDVTGAKRLTLLVDFGDAADIADRLNLCEARLIK